MCAQQIVYRPRRIAGHLVVGVPGVLHFFDVLGWPPDRFAVDDIGDLAHSKLVAFDSGGCVYRQDSVEPAQVQHIARLLFADLDALQQGVNGTDFFVPPRRFCEELFQRFHGLASSLGVRTSSMVGLFIGTIVHGDIA